MAASSASSVMPSTNDLSIFRVSTGSRARSWRSEAWPTPKSSTARRTPSALSADSVSPIAPGSAIIAVSVISRHSRPGSMPESSRARADDVDEVGRAELAGRHVDRHAERIVAPGGELAARLAQDPRADGDDEAVALGQRDEAQRRDDAEDRVVPAQQRLDAADAAVVERDERLVDEAQLAVVERVAQPALELQALHRALAHRVVEDLAARLAHAPWRGTSPRRRRAAARGDRARWAR